MSKQLTKFPYNRVLVLGLAKSGTSAAKLLLHNDKNVRITDLEADESDEGVIQLKKMGAELVLGDHPISVLDNIEIIIKNPGIPYSIPVIVEAQNRGIPIITEIELAGKLTEGPMIGITGSNGKTTTTILLTEMLEKSMIPVQMAGNIGVVATDVADKIEEDEALVLELSSFQLLGTLTFKPNIAIILNVYEAHLDYHKTLDNYQASKFNIFHNQDVNDHLIYNADNDIVAEAVKNSASILVPFSIKEKHSEGGWMDQKYIYFKNEKIITRQDIVLVGDHNSENILAAICAAKLTGASNEGIREVLTTFTGVSHRLQFIGKINDRFFYNDSKATNSLAAEKALLSFDKPTIWLAGGLDRGNNFDELLPSLKHVKAMVVFGETANKLVELANKVGITVKIVENMKEAVQAAYSISASNDIILLSPACASWDQFKTFEERGDMFAKAVHTLI